MSIVREMRKLVTLGQSQEKTHWFGLIQTRTGDIVCPGIHVETEEGQKPSSKMFYHGDGRRNGVGERGIF